MSQTETFDSGDALFSMDSAMRITSWNGAAERLTGKAARETVGRPCWEAIDGLNLDGSPACRPDCAWARSLREGQPVASQDMLVPTRSGLRRVTIATVSLNDRQAPRFLHVMRDGGAAEWPPGPDGQRPLSRRQRRVLELLADGKRAREIAETLGLSETTVRNHIRAVLARLGCHSQLQAVVEARRRGIV
jgi:PAS domain S-box-containing protein